MVCYSFNFTELYETWILFSVPSKMRNKVFVDNMRAWIGVTSLQKLEMDWSVTN